MNTVDALRDDLNCSARLRSRRRLVLVIFGLALLLLIVAVVVFVTRHRAGEQASVELQQARQALEQAQQRERLVDKRVQLHDAMAELASRAKAVGLAPSQWSQRLVSLRQQSISRASADGVIRSTGGGNGHLFSAEAFDLSVVRPDEGLFRLPDTSNRSLRITMNGTAFFSTRGP